MLSEVGEPPSVTVHAARSLHDLTAISQGEDYDAPKKMMPTNLSFWT